MPKHVEVAASYKNRLRWSEREARAALGALAESGLSARAFAAREGLDVQRLLVWRRRLLHASGPRVSQRPRAPTSFVQVRTGAAPQIEIVLRSGVLLRVLDTIDAATLRRLVDALDRPPC